MAIFTWLKEQKDLLLEWFSPETYENQTQRKYPSYITALFRLFVNYMHFVLPVIWVITVILCIAQKLPFLGVILVGILGAVLITLGLAFAFLLLMALESFSKILASLILSGELPEGAENPVDDLITRIFRGELY